MSGLASAARHYAEAQFERARVAFVHRRAGARAALQRFTGQVAAFLQPPAREFGRPTGALKKPADRLYYGTHPERGLTLESLISTYDAAERGDIRRQVDLIENLLERDPSTRNLFEQRRNAVTGKPFTVMAGAQDDASKRAAELLSERLSEVPNLGATCEHLLTHNTHGFASAEIRWERVERTIAPTWFSLVHQNRFRVAQPGRGFRPDEILLVTDEQPRGERLQPGRWITMRRSATIPAARAGLGRTAGFWMMFKVGAARDLAVYVHRFGIPFILARVNWADQDTRQAAFDLVNNFGEDGGGVASNKLEVDFPQPSSGRRDAVHGPYIALCDRQMAKLVYGVTLANDNEGSGGASYALSNTHEVVRWENIVRDAIMLQNGFRRHVAVPFMRFNNLPGVPPLLHIQVVQALHPREIVEIASRMKQDLTFDVDEDQIRSLIGLKAPANQTQDVRKDAE